MTRTQAVGAIFLDQWQPLSIEPLTLDAPQPGEVLVAMVASGVCHSDLHVVDGDWARPADAIPGTRARASCRRWATGWPSRVSGTSWCSRGTRPAAHVGRVAEARSGYAARLARRDIAWLRSR
ncbi:MAG: alcohol dehydrogenase catalytic domain-containing protein [Chloroflexota bacterium]